MNQELKSFRKIDDSFQKIVIVGDDIASSLIDFHKGICGVGRPEQTTTKGRGTAPSAFDSKKRQCKNLLRMNLRLDFLRGKHLLAPAPKCLQKFGRCICNKRDFNTRLFKKTASFNLRTASYRSVIVY